MTMSAPHSIGRFRYGVAIVESMIERDARRVGDLGETFDVGDLARRVRDRLGEDELRLVGDRGGVVGRVGALDERGLDTEAAQRHVELGDRAAVQVRRGDDVVARLRPATRR